MCKVYSICKLAEIMMDIVNGDTPDVERTLLHQDEGIDLNRIIRAGNVTGRRYEQGNDHEGIHRFHP